MRSSPVNGLLKRAFLFTGALWAAHGQVNVTTYHNDNARTGQNVNESLLSPATVNASQFGKLFSQSVDGYIYAQPLYVSNLEITGGTHDVVFVATEHDSVYAFDADTNTGQNAAPLWKVSFINQAAGVTTLNSISDTGCGDLIPEIGITGTPVIDIPSKTLYVVARTKENGAFYQRLHALDLSTGTEKFGGPTTIQASVAGGGDGAAGGKVSFDALRENQRAGLALQNGLVYIGWASQCDIGPYHGWLIAYNAQSLLQAAVWNATPNGSNGGIWQSGAAPAADSTSNLYVATGNGTFNLNMGGTDSGNSLVKLGLPTSGSLPLLDYFTPFDQAALNSGDLDLGSGGILLLPDLPAGSYHPHLLVAIGKEGKLYVVNRDSMGHFNGTGDTQVVQSIAAAALGGNFGALAFWNNTVYFGGTNDAIKAYSFNASGSGQLSASPVWVSSRTFPFPGVTPSLSSNGTSNGILWVLQTDAYGSNGPAILRAFDAANLGNELYNSTLKPQDPPGPAVKFAVPTVANGKVYAGTANQLAVYGVLTFLPDPPPLLSPANGAAGIALSASLSWAAATGATSYDVYLGTASPPPFLGNTTATGYSPSGLNSNTTYYWQVVARNSYGSESSPIFSFSTVSCPPLVTPSSIFLDSGGQSATLTLAATPTCAWSVSVDGTFMTLGSPATGTGSGQVTFTVPGNVTGTALSGLLNVGDTAVPVTQRESGSVFADVNPPDFYFDFANTLYGAGITAGCSMQPMEYCPNDGITRAQMAVFLVASALGTSNFSYTQTPYFTDVPAADPFFKFIQKLRDLGITNGCSETEFCPTDPVSRGQMAAFIIRTRYETTPYSYPTDPYFVDVPANHPFFPFVQKMAQTGITAGCGQNLYCPDTTLTRGQMAVFIVTGLLNRLLPAGTPVLTSASPAILSPGQTATVTLAGSYTHFSQGNTQVIVGPAITPSNIAVTNDTSMTVQFAIAPGAALNPYSIIVVTGAEETALPNGLRLE